jgi:hypothetical protein
MKAHFLTAMGLVHAGVGDLSGQGLRGQGPANQGFQSYNAKFNMTFWVCLSELKGQISKCCFIEWGLPSFYRQGLCTYNKHKNEHKNATSTLH